MYLQTGVAMDFLAELIVVGLIMVAIGAMLGAMVERPLAGALLSVFFGPIGWVILFVWAKQDKKVEQTGLHSLKQDPDQLFRAGTSPPR